MMYDVGCMIPPTSSVLLVVQDLAVSRQEVMKSVRAGPFIPPL